MRKLLFPALVILIFTSCTKKIELEPKSEIESLAQQTLSQAMAPQNFQDLDWKQVDLIKASPLAPVTILKIGSRTNASKKLYFESKNNSIHYNWVEIRNAKIDHDKASADVTLTDINNSVLRQFSIVDNKIQQTDQHKIQINSEKKKALDDVEITGTGGDATVVGYTKNNSGGNIYYRIDYILVGTANEGLYNGQEGGGGSASFSFPDPPPEEKEPDSVKVNLDGTTTYVSNFYWFIPGRCVTTRFTVNTTTKELVGGIDLTVTGVGMFGVTYNGIESAQLLGTSVKSLSITFNVTYTVPLLVVPAGDVSVKIRWMLFVQDITSGNNNVKLLML